MTDRHNVCTRDGSIEDYEVTVRVTFDDGKTSEFKTWGVRAEILGGGWKRDCPDLRRHGYGDSAIDFRLGDVIPVRYDPNDHSRLILDTAELNARFLQQCAADKARSEADTAALIARGEARAAGDQHDQEQSPAEWHVGGADVTSDPIERLGKLADLHERGALTDAEFAAEKAKILGEA